MLIAIVIISVIIGVWYYIESNKNLEQLKMFYAESKDLNTKQEVYNYTLKACKDAYSKLNASLLSLGGMGAYLSLHKNDSNTDDIKLFNKQICDCVNSKNFNIVDLFNQTEECKIGDFK